MDDTGHVENGLPTVMAVSFDTRTSVDAGLLLANHSDFDVCRGIILPLVSSFSSLR